MRDRVATIAPVAALAGMLGLCCGLPLLASVGVLGAVAGVSVRNWVLIGLGLLLAVVGWALWARRRRGTIPGGGVGGDVGGSCPPQDGAPDQTRDASAPRDE